MRQAGLQLGLQLTDFLLEFVYGRFVKRKLLIGLLQLALQTGDE